ncbi:MAG: hypothetical protein IPJ77_02590 [Planctomycetes bacterium]|nr:hypothetical protein [Planctomycetota bacterium]
MTGLRRTMGFVFALAAFQAPLWATNLDEVTDTFKQGVEQWQRGHEKEALDLFKKVLASSPTQESAYALWTDPDIGYAVWRELLTSGGEAELVAKRLIDLARVERKARANNEDAIKALVAEATGSDDPVARRSAIQKLSADHGEYAAAFLVGFLGSGMSDQDKTVRAMDTLNRMSTDVVVPLCTALASEDAVQRRNLCHVLGTIGDKRAAGYLAWLAASDADGSVKSAAQDAIQRAKWGQVDAVKAFLAAGDGYHHRNLRDEEYSDVVWSWTGGKLVPTPIPRAIYNDELAKTAYDHALTANPASVEALAGLARSYVAEASKLELLEKSGKDVGTWKSKVDEARLAVHAAGVPALDVALGWAVKTNDSGTGAALCRVLGSLCKEPCGSLNAALASNEGALRSEAAVALATIGLRAGAAPSADHVRLLGEAVGREVVRLAFVIDADEARGAALQAGLEKMGMFVSRWDSGAKALALARRTGGLDIVLASDKQKDITLAEIVDELKSDERLGSVPVVVVAESEEASQPFGERVAGLVKSADDLKVVQDQLASGLGGDRALADDLARRAAEVLAHVSHGGAVDLGATLGALQGAVVNRPDGVAIPAMAALGNAGGATQVPALLGVLADEARSEGVRIAAAHAVSGILGRNSSAVGAEGAGQLQTVAASGAPVPVRDAAARALGLVQMDAATRVELLRKLRAGTPAAN